jgi:excisionase family DNA binding protein
VSVASGLKPLTVFVETSKVVKTDRLLTVADVAEELRVPERFVRRLIFEKRIRYHKVGRYVRIAPADLERLIQDSSIDPVPPSRVRL